MPISTLLSYAQVEFECPREARILGVVDLEIRPLLKPDEPHMPKDLARHWRPRPLAAGRKFGEVLRRARARMNLPLREAAAMSRVIGDVLKNDRYAVSSSSFYDYEALNTAPRDFHKVITVCSLYGLQFQSFLKAMGIAAEEAGTESIPDHLVPRLLRTKLVERRVQGWTVRTGFLEEVLQKGQEVPFFLRDSLGSFAPSANVSLDDFFWLGGDRDPLHPYLANGLLALVNRRRRTAVYFMSRPLWQQPVYIILKRDGTHLGTCCGVENGTLVIHPYTPHIHRPAQFRHHQDAEVVGQIVAIARRVL